MADDKQYTFTDEDKGMVAISDDAEPDKVLLGVTGFDIAVVYDVGKLKTVSDIQNAVQGFAANLAQILIEDLLKREGEENR